MSLGCCGVCVSRESWLCLSHTELRNWIDTMSSEGCFHELDFGNCCFCGGGQDRQLSLKQFCPVIKTAFPYLSLFPNLQMNQGVLVALRKKCFWPQIHSALSFFFLLQVATWVSQTGTSGSSFGSPAFTSNHLLSPVLHWGWVSESVPCSLDPVWMRSNCRTWVCEETRAFLLVLSEQS